MLRFIDKFLNSITMYRLVMYGLGIVAAIAILLRAIGKLDYSPFGLFISLFVLVMVCYGVNFTLAKISKSPMNAESAVITALILFFIIAPPASLKEGLVILAVGVIAMISKYVLAIKHKHLFNPAAIAVLIIGLAGSGMAIWWIGSSVLWPFTLILGLLVVRKIRRFALFGTFLVVSIIVMVFIGLRAEQTLSDILILAITSWPLLFFGSIMLPEPQTTPPTRSGQIAYGALVGILFSSQFKFGPIYSTPELALVIGNILSYCISPKQRLSVVLQSSKRLSADIYEFIFSAPEKLIHKAGQYLEWTIPGDSFDGRGNRRYFTIASSPTEAEIRLGVRVSENGSAFKKQLIALPPGKTLTAAQLSGEFTLPADKNIKLVLIAGGIGITPFRSMVKYLIDQKEKRDVVLLYACISPESFVYQDIFAQGKEIGLQTNYVITETSKAPLDWQGKVGYIDEKMLQSIMADYKERTYYLSGPEAMVKSYNKLLRGLGISRKQIKKDYFPGF